MPLSQWADQILQQTNYVNDLRKASEGVQKLLFDENLIQCHTFCGKTIFHPNFLVTFF